MAVNDRRGVVFTLVALILVAYLLASDRVSDRFTTDSANAAVAQTRVAVLDSYLVSFEEHASASLATAGYLALSNMSDSVYQNGSYIVRLNETLARCILQDRIVIGGVERHCLPNATLLNHSLDALTAIGAQELGVTTAYTLHNVTMTQSQPFEIVMRLEFSYNITDAFGSFRRERRNVTAEIDMRGVEDPVYANLRSLNAISETRTFRETRLLRFALNITNFPELYENRTYISYEGQSPSILDRYQGLLDAQSDCCGIESVVRRDSLVGATADPYANRSLVDHEFARHIAGTLTYNCLTNDVRSFNAPSGGGRVVLETSRFDNLYNLTGSQLAACTWS